MMNVTFLDTATMGADLDLSPFSRFGKLTLYPNTSSQELMERIQDVDVLLLNKVKIRKEHIDAAHHLKVIHVAATGMDNVDVEYAKSKGIRVYNVAGYSTDSVAQTTFLLILSCMEHGPYFNEFVHSREYVAQGLPTHYGGRYFHELHGKRMGIIGLGAIGKAVAQIAEAFGMEVVYFSSSDKNRSHRLRRVGLDEMLVTCDVISIHSPLHANTRQIIGVEEFKKMKPTAYLFNLGRGAIINDEALVQALNEGWIAGAGLDVYAQEPLPADHCFYQVKDKEKLFLTPHIGWASIEARQRLVKMMVYNLDQHFNKE